jgi:hypothetical protein
MTQGTPTTEDEELNKADVAEKLRVAFQKVQACKRGDAKLDMQPVWDIINLLPSAVALLDAMPEFERDIAAEAEATRIEQLRKALEKYEGPNAGTWYYPEGDTSSDACCHSEYEVLDERYFDYDGPKTGVFSIERAVALPPLYAAVHAFTDAEKDERDSDDEYEVTFHVTADEARAALTGEHNG